MTWTSPEGVECSTCEVHGTVAMADLSAGMIVLYNYRATSHVWLCGKRRARRWSKRVGENVALTLAYIPDETYGVRILAVGMRKLRGKS